MKILLTGGNRRLCTELQALLPEIVAPTSGELDITDLESGVEVMRREKPDLIVYAAAYVRDGWRQNVAVKLPGDVNLDLRRWAALNSHVL